MSEPKSKNLSETLFQKHKQAKETSALIRYMPSSQEVLDNKKQQEGYAWYRNLRRLQWIWQGIDPVEQEEVLAKIASSKHSRTHDEWLDTVMGYHGGNWSYEWTKLGMRHQKRANNKQSEEAANELFSASLCFSIAGYPHLKNDNLSLQAQVLANSAYSEASKLTSYVIKQIEVPYKNKKIIVNLHLPNTDRPHPVIMVSAGLDSLQTDMWRLFRDYLAPRDIAMITIDMPSVGHSSHWPLTEDSSCLHQAVLHELSRLPWVDHQKVGLVGFRFGGNSMIRLSFLESDKIKACVSLGAPVHDIFTSPTKLKQMPKMYLDVLASRLGKEAVDIDSLSRQMMAWSLKVQGFLSSRRTKVPILALGLEGDPISPYSDNQLVALFSEYGKAKQIKSKTISQGYEQSLDLAIKWLEDELFR
ncbi:esterase FrsA [Vibrio aestuarianus]|uniref:Esterase FrsA n=1 Tax=Vibrio aestuarianus TaxID=28171 RepID=A0A9X4FD03_9VIBR|nr:esterase FrsA [Vibrio aestuarianus]MDE1230419.1 esterase FrsA [Vibrio aestuarianus]MDE1233465.1 esterase FrsA [Vibrio aestuarianus]MDE1240640.1 esterase FrsA [Vibrio aestuarianus]MDE1244343.1 esterase FrsA [Vibrio aestuarianus]MDE1310388.1 esterase FrsA [Vibrio aestuarianus]